MTDNNTALKKAGLKVTLPRLKILEVLQEPDNHHVSAEYWSGYGISRTEPV